jgi:hypothetical protein
MLQNSENGLRAFLPAGLMCLLGLIVAFGTSMPAAGTSASGIVDTRSPDRMIAAVFPPWWDDADVLVAAASTGLPIVRAGGIGAILVLASPNESTDNLVSKAGAVLLLDPLSMAGCLSLQPT